MRRLFFLLILSLWALPSYGQTEKFTVSGYIRDASSGEDLIGAGVYVEERETGALTNAYGYYSITLPLGNYTLRVNYIGYRTQTREIQLNKDITLNVEMPSADSTMEAIVISADDPRQELERTQMSKIELNVNTVKELPALFGEVDILKTIQLLPGVQAGAEGSTGFYVRGGGPDQNLIVLDEAVVYNASHLFGLFSVFNSDAIRNVELYKGGFPARYGGRLSSVVDINLKDGNNKKIAGAGGIGIIASRLTIEGPIIKDKASFIVSGRRTYFDIFTNLINKANEDKEDYTPIPGYHFYDLNAKINYKITDRDRLFLSGYFGRDVFKYNLNNFNFGFDWGNATGTLRWNHLFNPRLFANLTATVTDYQYEILTGFDLFEFSLGSNIRDYTFKADFDWKPTPNHSVRYGLLGTYHDFAIGRVRISGGENGFDNTTDRNAIETGIYAQDDWDINEKLRLSYGLRLTGFRALRQSDKEPNDTFYWGPEPRLATRYKLNDKVSLKGSYSYVNQYVQLISNSGASLPTDFWYPSNANVKPQRSHQAAAGVTLLIFKEKFLLTNEVYYKWLRNQIDFRDGAQIYFNPELDQELVFGKGWSYGNEIFLEKRDGKLTGWIGYTLSWTRRQFEDINNGETFSPRYDNRHDIKVVASYEVSKRLNVAGTFIFTSGNAVSIPTGYVWLNDIPSGSSSIIPYYPSRNNYRQRDYHRADLSIVYKFFPKWGESNLTLSVYNLYNRRNAYSIYIESEFAEDLPGLNIPVSNQAKQISLFPIIPSLTWNFTF